MRTPHEIGAEEVCLSQTQNAAASGLASPVTHFAGGGRYECEIIFKEITTLVGKMIMLAAIGALLEILFSILFNNIEFHLSVVEFSPFMVTTKTTNF